MREFLFLLGCFFCTAHGAFPHTDSLKTHMLTVEGQATALTSCLHRVTHPLGEASKFSKEVVELEGLITHLEKRVKTTVTLLHAALAIPFIGQVASPVLGPASTILTKIGNEIATVKHSISHVVSVIKGWLKPLEVIQHAVGVLNTKIGKVVSIMSKVETEIQKIETCVSKLPAGHVRTTAETALEKVSATIDHVPKALVPPVTSVASGCTKVQHFLAKIGVVKRKRGLPALSKAIKAIESILKAMGPVGKFLDKVDDKLSKKICLVGDLLKLGGKVVSKVAHTVEHTVEHVGHSISHAVHHIFGKKRLVVMDADFDARGVRGLDICLSVKQVLKKINGFTHGMLKEAEKLITGLFHGISPFHIPSLTNDVLHLGSILKSFTSSVPSVAMSIAEPLIVNALHLNTNGYIQAIPDCAAAIHG